MKKIAKNKATAAASTFASMRPSRRQSSLAELHAALKPLEKDGVKPDSVIFNDLGSGALVTEVHFPDYRQGVYSVRAEYWQREVEFDHLFDGRSYGFNGGKYNGEFYVTASMFAAEERKKLERTSMAVWRDDLADSDGEFRAYFKSKGWVDANESILDREKLFEFCFRAEHELTKAEVNDVELQVWVRSPHLHDYLDEVSARLAPPDPKETRTENWVPIYEEIIRRLALEAGALRRGNVEAFVRDLGEWARQRYGTRSVAGDKRLRQRIDEIIKPVRHILDSNKR
jgi:hypothetical protein